MMNWMKFWTQWKPIKYGKEIQVKNLTIAVFWTLQKYNKWTNFVSLEVFTMNTWKSAMSFFLCFESAFYIYKFVM